MGLALKTVENAQIPLKLAQMIDTTPAYVNRVIRQKETVVNRTFISMVEALGYDIRLTYVKRSKRKKADENEN